MLFVNAGGLARGVEQGFERIGEQPHAVIQKLVRNFLHGDAGLGEILHDLRGRGDVLGQAGTQLTVFAEGIEGRGRNGVDGFRADQFLDIEDVAILRILGAGTGPE